MRNSLFNQEVAVAQQSLEKSWRSQMDSLRDNLTGTTNGSPLLMIGKINALNADKLRLERDVSETNSKLTSTTQQVIYCAFKVLIYKA